MRDTTAIERSDAVTARRMLSALVVNAQSWRWPALIAVGVACWLLLVYNVGAGPLP